MQIRVYETVSQMPNGDRDPHRHPCSEFEVVLVNGDRRSSIFRNNQYDKDWSSIRGTRAEYLNEAMAKAEEFGKTLGSVEIVGVNLTKHETRMMELEKSIKKDQAELDKLKKMVL